jgi:hypothetical protein
MAQRSQLSAGKKIGFALVTALLFFVVLEAVLQVVLPRIARHTIPTDMMEHHLASNAFVYDPDLLWYWKELPNGEQDPDGFRRVGPRIAVPKPEHYTRAIAFGDSQTLGPGLQWTDAWPSVVDKELGKGWEVLNAAVPGYRSLNVYRLLRKKIIALDPDIILVDCMPYDSPRDDLPLDGSVSVEMDGPQRLKALFWESYTYFLLRRGLEMVSPHRYRWLDESRDYNLRTVDGEGNHELIAQWAWYNDVIPVFTEYAVWDEGHDRLNCFTLPGELPEGAVVAPVCDALEASGLPLDQLFFDANHYTKRGAEIMGAQVANTLKQLEL